ncbi:patatin [Aquiflexum gelatinilyticum]|uniref:patatin n=1 Tax=Aquiflexum gelatinilyticum TaxID=2961943 RepID=UPI002168E799|nr:patatin [Aquiflexum gelatinilyticum]MCS4436921.1 patatin [Aquiflexum gelatinilyticum]
MKKYLTLIVIAISMVTVISGLTQVFMPATVLKIIGADITDSTNHLFGIVGMFMALFGGMLIHNIYSIHPSKVVVVWCALQKLGAFVAVSLGVMSGLFSWMALSVAIFDLFSGLLFLYYMKTLPSE